MKSYWYQTQERAFAPGISDGWPETIPAPHSKNGRLVRMVGDPVDLLAAARNALTRLDREDAERRAAGTPAAHDGVVGSVNDQLRAAIAKAEGRS